MNLIYRFFQLNNETKLLLIRAWLVLCMIRIMLWVFSFNRTEKIIKRYGKVQSAKEVPLKKLTWAVQVMGDFFPKSTCLVRALSGQVLLAQYGYSSQVMIGVSQSKGEFEAHAWLKNDGEVILGESEIDYVPIRDMGN